MRIFNPDATKLEFTIAAGESVAIYLVPKVIEMSAGTNQKIRIRCIPLDLSTIKGQLEEGRVDLMVSYTNQPPPTLRRSILVKDTIVGVKSKNNKSLDTHVSLEKYLAQDHVYHELSKNHGSSIKWEIDRYMTLNGLSRRKVCSVHSTPAVASTVGMPDMIAVLPRCIAELLERSMNLALFELPMELDMVSIGMYWPVAGQSSGASSVVCLTSMPRARGLFKRAIVQSAPLGRPERTPAHAAELGANFLRHADVATSADLQHLPVEHVLRAQTAYSRSFFAPPGATHLAFMPVTDGAHLLSQDRDMRAPDSCGCDLIIGTTREQMAALYAVDSRMRTLSKHEAIGTLGCFMSKADAEACYDSYAMRRASDVPASILGDAFTDGIFRSRSIDLARRFSDYGQSVYVYRFYFQSPAGFEACHCLDIPFVFNNPADWPGSPMLQGINEDQFNGISRKIQAWTAFARFGSPDHDAISHWEPINPQAMQMMKFDRIFEMGPIECGVTLQWPD